MLCSNCGGQRQVLKSSNATNTAVCNKFHKGLDKLRLDGKYSDVSIRIDNEIFQCHRVVLASVCKVFDSMFGGNFKEASQGNAITLSDIDAASFEIILEFIYLGRKPLVTEDNVYELFRSSDFLQLQQIRNMCVNYISRNASSFSSINIFKIFHLACGMNDRLVMDTSSKYIIWHLKDFVQEDFFVEMAYDCLNLVLQTYLSSPVHFNSENFLLDATFRWVFHNYKERQKFFKELIEMINVDKITSDCVEFWLKECKMGYKVLKKLTIGAPLKALLNAFSTNYKFTINDDALPVSFEDLPSRISPSIHVYVLSKSEDKRVKQNVSVFSLNKLNYGEIEDQKSLSSQSSLNEHTSKSEWVVSYKLSCNANYLDHKFRLVTQNKRDLIYYFYKDKFCAYSSINLSSNKCTKLTAPKRPIGEFTDICATNNSSIYVHRYYGDCDIRRYDCIVDKWFTLPTLEEKTFRAGFVADKNLLYLIGGEDCGKDCNNFIRVYDCRTPKWLCLSNAIEKNSTSSLTNFYYRSPQSCVKDDKIYVFDGKKFRVFDVTARFWENMKLGRNDKYYWSCSSQKPPRGKCKMICHENNLLVFNEYSLEYLIYNYKTEKFDKLTLFDHSYYESSDFFIGNVIVFNSM